jgi:hypothetical protein
MRERDYNAPASTGAFNFFDTGLLGLEHFSVKPHIGFRVALIVSQTMLLGMF